MSAMKKKRSFNSFQELLENSEIEFEKTVETVSRQDENMANNRLFVWNFESSDLEEMIDIFTLFKRDTSNEATRQRLSSNLLRKMNGMLREGYNPVECMLYASKTINQKLNNDKSVQDILAERIRDVYLKKEDETADILRNIIDMWTWLPQLKVVINAIGLIGENEELLDIVSLNYGDDEALKDRAFHAFMQNKTMNNLERALKIVINLQNIETDQIMGRRFAKEVGGFGWDGIKMIEKYNDNPAVSRTGKNVIRRIMRDNGNVVDGSDDEMYRETLVNKSQKDDMAFKDFIEDCQRIMTEGHFSCAVFPGLNLGSFLKQVLEDSEGLDSSNRNDAIISMALVGKKGYSPAAAVIKNCYQEGEDNFAVLIADMILGSSEAVKKLVDLFCERSEQELFRLYGILKTSNLKFYIEPLTELQCLLEERFRFLLERQDYLPLEMLASNLQILWDKRLYFILPISLLKYMQSVLKDYAKGGYSGLPEAIVIDMIQTIVYNWNNAIENVIFSLYHDADNPRVRQLSYKILQRREVQAPQ